MTFHPVTGPQKLPTAWPQQADRALASVLAGGRVGVRFTPRRDAEGFLRKTRSEFSAASAMAICTPRPGREGIAAWTSPGGPAVLADVAAVIGGEDHRQRQRE